MAETAAITAITSESLQENATIRYTSASISFQSARKSFQRLIFDRLNTIGLELATPESDVHLPSAITIKAAEKNTPGALFLISQDTQRLQQQSETSLTLWTNLREIEKTLEKMI